MKASCLWTSSAILEMPPLQSGPTELTCTLTHREHGPTEVAIFLLERHDYRDYHPWIDIDTWTFVLRTQLEEAGTDTWSSGEFEVEMHVETIIEPGEVVICE